MGNMTRIKEINRRAEMVRYAESWDSLGGSARYRFKVFAEKDIPWLSDMVKRQAELIRSMVFACEDRNWQEEARALLAELERK